MINSAKSLKQSSSASYANMNWPYPFEHALQPGLLVSVELDVSSLPEFSESAERPVGFILI